MSSITLDYNKYKRILRDLDTALEGWRNAISREREASCEVGGELDDERRDDVIEIETIRARNERDFLPRK